MSSPTGPSTAAHGECLPSPSVHIHFGQQQTHPSSFAVPNHSDYLYHGTAPNIGSLTRLSSGHHVGNNSATAGVTGSDASAGGISSIQSRQDANSSISDGDTNFGIENNGLRQAHDILENMKMSSAPKGSGPRLFCGHVPKEVTEDLVKAHFSRWGIVTDVYFPRHKKTLKRRPFCFVTFATKESADRALEESPYNICGIPIKNITMVEDRDKYYKDKHAAARQALLAALTSLGGAGSVPNEHVNNIAALLAMDGISPEVVLSALIQQYGLGANGTSNASAGLNGLNQGPTSHQTQGVVGNSSLPSNGHISNSPSIQGQFLQHQYMANNQTRHSVNHMSNPMQGPNIAPMINSVQQFGNPPNPVYPHLMHREGSINSMSSNSDWLSVGPTSARNSIEIVSPYYLNKSQVQNSMNIPDAPCAAQQLQSAFTGTGSDIAIRTDGQNIPSGIRRSVPIEWHQTREAQQSRLPVSDPQAYASAPIIPSAIFESGLYGTTPSGIRNPDPSAATSGAFSQSLAPISEASIVYGQNLGGSFAQFHNSLARKSSIQSESLPPTSQESQRSCDAVQSMPPNADDEECPQEVTLLEALKLARDTTTP